MISAHNWNKICHLGVTDAAKFLQKMTTKLLQKIAYILLADRPTHKATNRTSFAADVIFCISCIHKNNCSRTITVNTLQLKYSLKVCKIKSAFTHHLFIRSFILTIDNNIKIIIY